VRRIEAIKDGTSIVGNRTRVKVVKNKVAPPFREAQFDILYNEGISRLGDLIDTAVEQNIIAKSGSWFSYKEERIGQGRDAVKKYLQENDKIARSIDTEMRKKLGLPGTNGNHAEEKKPSPPQAAPKGDEGQHSEPAGIRRPPPPPAPAGRAEALKKK
jgi:recombination protein RecA